MKISKLLPLIGIVIFAYLLYNIDLGQVANRLIGIKWTIIVAAVPVFALTVILKAVKWNLIIRSYGVKVATTKAISSWLIGFSISLITPGKLGDFARAYYIKDKTDLGKSLTTVMADRVIDIIVLFILAMLGMVFFLSVYTESQTLVLPMAILFIAFMAAVFIFSKKPVTEFFIRPFFNRFAPESRKNQMKKLFEDFYSGIGLMRKRKRLMLASIILTFAVWFVTIFQFYLMGLSLGIDVPYTFLVSVFPVVMILEALPISFSGVGTREAALIFFFAFAGISAEAAVSLSIFLLITNYIIASIGFAFWLKDPIGIKNLGK